MKVLVITPYYFPHFGGSQAYIHRLYSALKKHQPDIQVDVLCYNTKHVSAVESIDGITVYRVPAWEILADQFALPNPISLFLLLKQLRKNNYDVVNAHTRFFDVSWWTPLVAKWFHAKSIFTDHCASFPAHQSILVNSINQFIDHVLVPFIVPFYDVVTTVSDATGIYLQSLGIKSFTTIPGAVKIPPHKNVSKTPKSIAFVGRLIPSKNPELFIDAMNQLLQHDQTLKVTVAGDGPLLDLLKQKADSQIVFAGALPAAKVAELLQKTFIVVHPSQHHEGLPQVLLEAGTAECLVLATDQGGSKEVVIENKTGIIIEPTVESIIQNVNHFLSKPAEMNSLRSNLAKHVALNFDIDKVSQKYLALLRSL